MRSFLPWLLFLGMMSVGCGDDLSLELIEDTGPQVDPIHVTDPLRQCGMPSLARLQVVGNQLRVACHGQLVPVRLKGINRSGLQHKRGLQQAGFGSDPTPELRAWREQWQAVIIRLPIAQNYYLDSDSYRQDLAAVIAAAKSLGIYLLLELHGYDEHNLNPPQPDPVSTPLFWRQVAQRFGGETHVLFDLWNEPHDVAWSTWKQNAERIIQAIRAEGASETVVVVGGLDYAYDLQPLLDPQNRITGLGPILYATHPYPLKTLPPAMAPEWDRKFGQVAQLLPVIVGEYGVDDSRESGFGLGSTEAARLWLAQLHRYLDRRQLSALAWSGGDMPHLTLGQNGGGVILPTNPPNPSQPTEPFGSDVRAWMSRPTP